MCWRYKQKKEESSCNDKMQKQMELQLHEQYAINNNANLGSVVVLLAAMIGVFWGYGYIFLHSTNSFSNDLIISCCCKDMYTLDALIFSAIAVFVVTGILRLICLVQGYGQRFEQFITFAIRCKYYENKMEKKIFPNNYHPFKIKPGKEKSFEMCLESNCMEKQCLKPYLENKIAQGLFGEIAIILCWMDVLIIFSLIIKISFNITENFRNGLSTIGILECFFLIIVLVFVWSENIYKRDELRDKYLERVIEYKDYYQYTKSYLTTLS